MTIDLDTKLDVLIVGGGIVGAGAARDAAMRGLRVAVIDQSDFASGTSSRSSRLLHGGLRYLAQGRIAMVREASSEKRILHHIAPHLCAPLAFVFPTRRGTPWTKWKLHIGVKLYDLLCRGGNLGASSGLSIADTQRLVPGLSTDHLTGAVRYFDGFTNDARLVIDTLRSAYKHGAILQSYCKLVSAKQCAQGWRSQLLDVETGVTREVVSRTLTNAAGPWADKLPGSQTHLRLTKGVHLVIDRARLPLTDALVMTDGGRILFAIPWGERMILGTTDTDYSGDPAMPTCQQADADYIFKIVNATFPEAKLSDADIISTWAGVRPLIADKNGAPSDISRRHSIRMTEPGWFDVAGGKLTTYRLMAEQTIDQVLLFLGRSRTECTTHLEPLIHDTPRFSGIIPPAVTREAVEHFVRSEWARHLDDVMIRRSSWGIYHREHLAIAAQVAGWMGEILNWNTEVCERELARYRSLPHGICP
jgi:glycerol-3-phosphate dehydrogenase